MKTTTPHYVIIGNGAAGISAAETLRRHDKQAQITILTAEKSLMYSRPGLAYVITGEIAPHQVIARTREWYDEWRVKLVYGRAVHIDVPMKAVHLAGGRQVSYDKLLIATGARAVSSPYEGGDLPGVVYLDTLEGTKEMVKRAKWARRGVVLGGGITAIEMTEGLIAQKVETHYFLRRDRLWGRVFNETEAGLLEAKMKAHGVHLHYHTEITEILPARWGHKVGGVRLKNGDRFRCDLVGIAIGVRPQLDVLHRTPIERDRGILVDSYLQSSVPDIYAAGDVAQVYDEWTEQHMLDVLWPSAVAEGKAAALNMMGACQPYRKGIPFNVCKYFGLHITIIGQIDPQEGESEVLQHLSRGSSEVWHTRPRHHVSAWAADGPNTLRLVLDGDVLVGALIVGEQTLADPLRYLIEQQVDLQPYQAALQAGGDVLKETLLQVWHQRQGVR